MYCAFYGLTERPFNVTSDPAFFFFSAKHQEAISHLFYGVTQRKGISVLTGDIGTGKTTICRYFLNQLDKNTKSAIILNPYFSDTQLLEAIVRDFGLDIREKTRLGYVRELNKFLLRESQERNNCVLIVDEAQNLKPQQLEQLRLLSNLETAKDKLLQIVLVGQPELKRKLELPELRQLRQRIMVRYHIMPLEENDIKSYVTHRLRIAGAKHDLHFTDETFRMIYDFSLGVPRLVNILCDRALLAGFVKETASIGADILSCAMSELDTYAVREACV